jgi:hypothetical protein
LIEVELKEPGKNPAYGVLTTVADRKIIMKDMEKLGGSTSVQLDSVYQGKILQSCKLTNDEAKQWLAKAGW